MPTPTFPVSGFADEISTDLSIQIETLRSLNVRGLDVRGVDGKNVLELSDERLNQVRETAALAGIAIHCVGSPVNKVRVSPKARKEEVEKLKRSIEAAAILQTSLIRVFTPEAAACDDDGAHWPEVRSWMSEMADMAKDAEVTLIHENDAKFFGAYPNNCRRMMEELGGPHFRALYDFANAVLIGYRPPAWMDWIVPHLDSLHIKDAVQDKGQVVPAGEGDGEVVETLRFLTSLGWNGTLTLEPHLKAAGPLGGFSGPELFGVAALALEKCVLEAGGALA